LQARPGEEVSQCWFTDETFASSHAHPIGGCAAVPIMAGCGVGCLNCNPLAGEICMFVSQTFPTGVCLPGTNRLTALSMVCKAQNPRIACPRGQACILPIRGDRDGTPDRERSGICAPVERCTYVAGRLPEGYLRDQTLVPWSTRGHA
jgi:hypothetical protein